MKSDILNSDGTPAYGIYTGDIADVSLKEYPQIKNILKAVRHKKWRFVGFFSEKVVCGIAVVDAGYIGSTFAYAFDMETKKLSEYRATSPFSLASRISDNTLTGEAVFKHGLGEVRIDYGLDGGKYSKVSVTAPTVDGTLEIEVEMDDSISAAEPHQVVHPTPKRSFAFTHKTAGVPVKGRVKVGEKEYLLESGKSFGAVDHTAGYHDYHWEWRWASLGGLSKCGKRVGLNLVEPLHHPTIQENALWIDGKRIALGKADFIYDKQSILEPWEINTESGIVKLKFEPLGKRSETINAGIIKSCFSQPVGLYSGEFSLPDGEHVILENVPGVAEDHEARW